MEKEKNIEIREIRNKLSKQVQDNEILQEDIQKMKQKLKVREKNELRCFFDILKYLLKIGTRSTNCSCVDIHSQ